MVPSLYRCLYSGVAGTFLLRYTQTWVSEGGREFENFRKKGVFLVSIKNKFHHFWPPVEKRLEKSNSGPPEKFLPRPMHIISM